MTERILVQLADRQWTLEATHLACQIARMRSAEIVFVKMIAVQHLSWLGTDLGYRAIRGQDYHQLLDCAATAEDYQVPCVAQTYQYLTFVDGICSAADDFQTDYVFAAPNSPLKPLRQWQTYFLRRSLRRHGKWLADEQLTTKLLAADHDRRLQPRDKKIPA